jgi:hypothetical protein
MDMMLPLNGMMNDAFVLCELLRYYAIMCFFLFIKDWHCYLYSLSPVLSKSKYSSSGRKMCENVMEKKQQEWINSSMHSELELIILDGVRA